MKGKVDRLPVEQDVIAGNYFNKYETANPVARRLVRGFCASLTRLVELSGAKDLHEVGCGEGYLTALLAREGRRVLASDVSAAVIAKARAAARAQGLNAEFTVKSIYDLDRRDAAELVVCCEVLEHLHDPERALAVLSGIACPYLLISVPREPLWRILNMARGKYWCALGNTPGHLQHWTGPGIIRALGRHAEPVEILRPLPWTMILARAKR